MAFRPLYEVSNYAPNYKTVQLLRDDVALSYTAGTGKYVVASGDVVETPIGNYVVLPSDDASPALTTAGGVLLGFDLGSGTAPSLAHWGYDSTGTHDIQPAIDWMAAQGGGVLRLEDVITLSATAILPSKVIIQGVDMFKTGLRAADGLNDDVVRTKDFSTLQGSNLWKTADGVPYGFGLVDLFIDGNKANNTSGRGWAVYGKGYTYDNLRIFDTAEQCWWSECAYAGGQDDETDLPEGSMGRIFIANAGTRGAGATNSATYRGPHDGRLGSVVISGGDGNGINFETDGATYNGKCDVDFIHAYGCFGKGINWAAGGSATHLIGESCDEEGVLVSGNDAQVSMIEAYRNGIRSATEGREYNVYITGAGHKITSIETRDSALGEGGVNNSSNRSEIGVHCDGQGTSAKTGLVNTGTKCRIVGQVNGFDQTGGVGVDLTGDHCSYDLTINDCATAIDIGAASICVDAKIRADLLAGQVLFSGVDPMSGSALNKETSEWDVSATIDTTHVGTRQRKVSGSSFDATQAVGTTGVITSSHYIPFTPDASDVTCCLFFDDGAGGAPAGTPSGTVTMHGPPSSSQCFFRWEITKSGSASDRGFISFSIKY